MAATCIAPIHTVSDEEILKLKPKVVKIAALYGRRMRNQGSFDIEDLISIGFIGLIKAASRYNPSLNVTFSTFAEFRVRGEILDFLRISSGMGGIRSGQNKPNIFIHSLDSLNVTSPEYEDYKWGQYFNPFKLQDNDKFPEPELIRDLDRSSCKEKLSKIIDSKGPKIAALIRMSLDGKDISVIEEISGVNKWTIYYHIRKFHAACQDLGQEYGNHTEKIRIRKAPKFKKKAVGV